MQQIISTPGWLFFVLITISACQSMPPQLVDQNMLQKTATTINPVSIPRQPMEIPAIEIPTNVQQALLPKLQIALPQPPSQMIEPRFNVVINDMSAKQALIELTQDTPYSVLIHPSVTGKLSLQIKAATMAEIFQLIEEVYGYTVQLNGTRYTIYGTHQVGQLIPKAQATLE